MICRALMYESETYRSRAPSPPALASCCPSRRQKCLNRREPRRRSVLPLPDFLGLAISASADVLRHIRPRLSTAIHAPASAAMSSAVRAFLKHHLKRPPTFRCRRIVLIRGCRYPSVHQTGIGCDLRSGPGTIESATAAAGVGNPPPRTPPVPPGVLGGASPPPPPPGIVMPGPPPPPPPPVPGSSPGPIIPVHDRHRHRQLFAPPPPPPKLFAPPPKLCGPPPKVSAAPGTFRSRSFLPAR